MTECGSYLCSPLWSYSSNVLLYHVADVEPLQELGRLQIKKKSNELFDFQPVHWCLQPFGETTHLLHYRRRREPSVFLQDCSGKVLFQPREVVLPHVRQVLAVVNAGRLIPGHETFDEPGTDQQTGDITAKTRNKYILTAVLI